MPVQKYSTTTTHTIGYYKAVLLVLIDCLQAGQSHASTAETLNSKHLKTPTGLSFTASVVKESLKKIRLNQYYPSKFHFHVLQLVFLGEFTREQVAPLYKSQVM